MLIEAGLYGLLVLDRREAHVGWLKGTRIEPVKGTTSRVPGKQRKGGQSAQRFHRLRLEAIDQFYKEIAELAGNLFVPDRYELDGILVGGPSPTKDEFIDGNYLHHELREKVLGKFDISYTDESGLSELVNAASDVLADAAIIKEKVTMNRFFKELRQGERATYGFMPTRENLIMGAVDRLLISSDLRKDVINIVCGNGHQNYEIIDTRSEKVEKNCSDCGEKVKLVEREDVVKHLIELAEYRGTKIEFVSTDFEEGNQLLHAFGGIAGVLRFPTNI
jgi:peptide chain release factor subunit 1